jgi:DNA-binding PadR family transcriptional regulator
MKGANLDYIQKAVAGKEDPLIILNILKMINDSPKSGYDIIKEFEKRTGGALIPSKGTIYPLLGELEKKKLIRVKKIGPRSKKIYDTTDKVKVVVKAFPTLSEAFLNGLKIKPAVLSLFHGEKESGIMDVLFKIWETSVVTMNTKNGEVLGILKSCFSDLENLQKAGDKK